MTDLPDILARLHASVDADLPVLRETRVVLAASGGADSTAMIAMLVEARLIDPARTTVAHFDHRLRDTAASDADRAAVAAVCERYRLPMIAGAWDAPDPREAASRDARYRFLFETAARVGAAAALTGHTSDDQAETVLMHALRGAGLHGLAGMPYDAPWPHAGESPLRLWRPLLALTRGDTLAACDALDVAYHDDGTNADRRYLRNRVRLDVLPQLEAAWPNAAQTLLALAAASRAALDVIAPVVAPAIEAPLHPPRDCVALSRAAVRALPEELRAHAARLALMRLLGDAREFDRRHYAIAVAAVDARSGTELMLPRGVVLTVDPMQLLFSRGLLRLPAIAYSATYTLPFAGVVGGWEIDARATVVGAVVRGRRDGDRIRPRGMRGHKKLQDYYTDRKIPRRLRDAAPVVAIAGDVLWTPWGVAEGVDDGAVRAAYAADSV